MGRYSSPYLILSLTGGAKGRESVDLPLRHPASSRTHVKYECLEAAHSVLSADIAW
jgi:hypothetical protein